MGFKNLKANSPPDVLYKTAIENLYQFLSKRGCASRSASFCASVTSECHKMRYRLQIIMIVIIPHVLLLQRRKRQVMHKTAHLITLPIISP